MADANGNDGPDAEDEPLAHEGQEEALDEDEDDAPISFDGDASDHEDGLDDLSHAGNDEDEELMGDGGLGAVPERPLPAVVGETCPGVPIVNISDSPIAPSPIPVPDHHENSARMVKNLQRLERLRELRAQMLQTTEEIEFLG